MLARRDGRHGLGKVLLVGGGDVDGVDVTLQERVEVAESVGDPVLRRVAAGTLGEELRTETTSPPVARIAPIMCEAAILLAPIRPQRMSLSLRDPVSVTLVPEGAADRFLDRSIFFEVFGTFQMRCQVKR
jgi:hypothetical protein